MYTYIMHLSALTLQVYIYNNSHNDHNKIIVQQLQVILITGITIVYNLILVYTCSYQLKHISTL